MKKQNQVQRSHMQKNFSTCLLFLVGVTFLVTACTKTKDTVSKVDPAAYVTKADYEGKVFSLVRGVEEADSNNEVGAIPGISQDFGFVKVRITEDEIQLISVFNPYNKESTQAILASYRIKDHFDIRREENDFREATHRIVENKDRPWSQREYMRVDWATPTNKGSSLAASTDAPESPTENVVLLTDPKKEDGHISWLTEFSAPGAAGWWGVSDSSRITIRTHLMPVKQTDFQALNYRDADFQKFGMFFTQQVFEDPAKGLTDKSLEDHTFANLHNICEAGRRDANGKALSCSTNKVVWHLTKNFPEKFRDVARRSVREWNSTFQAALNRTDDVVTLDESFDVDMIDPRYNTIANYSDKSPGGLLGVAQKVSNPITGEVIASRATVFADGIQSELGYVDDLVNLILQDDELRKSILAADAESPERLHAFIRAKSPINEARAKKLRSSTRQSMQLTGGGKIPKGSLEVRRNIREIASKLTEPIGRSLARKERLMQKDPGLYAIAEQTRTGLSISGYDETFGLLGARRAAASRLSVNLDGLEHLHDAGSSLREERARMINQAASGVHGAELVQEATLRYIKKVLRAHPEASDFKTQIATLKTEIEQNIFYTTLLHEMGHTFGLRHNFIGSADAKHYQPEFFRLSKVIESERNLPESQKTVSEADLEPYMFSSIMDYGSDFYSQIGGLGPYDNAAIKYAYNRSIDKKNDPIVTANFQFCTDHQVNESILCRRFDKGRNISEITFNLIETYQTNYVLSHNRRNRAEFERRARSYPMAAISRYFIPVRQVMDEALFALINSETVSAGENECDQKYWRESVERGEVVNICNAVEAEQAGVDPTNLETFEAGLFNEKGLRKNPIEYKPYGLADLLFANVLAKEFFSDVLGSTEPGRYIAEPIAENSYALQKLPDGKDLDESISNFAQDRGLELTPELVEGIKGLIGEVKPGRYGKVLQSQWDESGTETRQLTIGSFWDKYVAMIALGLKDIGVDKYRRHSMSGNAYSFPGTTGFAQKVIKSMIVQQDRLTSIPFQLKDGEILATVEPSLNLDIRAIATITALTDFVSDGDNSIVGKMSVCSVDEKGCMAPFGQTVAEFVTASGQNKYRSAQTQKNDSIAFDLVSSAAKLDVERNDWLKKIDPAGNTAAQNIIKLTELATKREALEKTLVAQQIDELTKLVPTLLSVDPKIPSMWGILNVIVTQGSNIPLFSTLNLAQQAGDVLNYAGQILSRSLEALDPSGACPTPGKGQESEISASAGVDCRTIAQRQQVLVAARNEFQEFATVVSGILNSSLEVKVAPLRAQRLTDQLIRAEANVDFIRQVSKAAGLQ